MSEITAYRVFRLNVTAVGDRIDRIENLIGLGFPDTNCCFNGIEFWMEIKAPTEPKRPTTPLFGSNHNLSQAQKNWFLRQRKAKGLAFIYVETEKRRMLVDGKHADVLNNLTVAELVDVALWVADKPTAQEEWADLRALFAHHG